MLTDFLLPETDQLFLKSFGLPWEAKREANYHWLLVKEYKVPVGYNVNTVCVALMIPPGYPTTQIDMAYFYPHLSKSDGKPIGALAIQMIAGLQFQRWSRHRTVSNPWRPGVDDISTHLQMVNYWLERELKK